MAADCELVAEELRKFGINAFEWESGGGMVGVGIAHGSMPQEELLSFFGTAGEFWAGEVYDAEGEVIGGAVTDVLSNSDAPLQVAAGILDAIAMLAKRTAASR